MKKIVVAAISLIIIIISLITLYFFKKDTIKDAVTKLLFVEKIVMPGAISDDHKEYEKDCESCHAPFSKESQNSKCIVCHKEVGADLEAKQGYHGLYEQISKVKCKACHSEHKGRDSVLIVLDVETFNHEFTNYKLVGAHADSSVSCNACHGTGKKYREVEMICFNCHEKNDIHKGELGKECQDCHRETSFKDVSFDHSKTDFALQGKHKDVACSLCHPNARFKDTPTTCISCHLINDIHDSESDAKCDGCHSIMDSWEKFSFDHAKESNFVLKGRHSELKCDSCHIRKIFKEKLEMKCFNCHNEDDVHNGRFASECEKCHDPVEWQQVKFDHEKDTKFKLLGKHKEAACIGCHKNSIKEDKLESITCSNCHVSEDVHQGRLGTNCDTCHNVNGWGGQVKFDHDLTKFPLIGVHAVTPCGECHPSATFKEDISMDCVSCHELDDKHGLKLGTNCARCHNPNGWAFWEFDHNSQTEFKLEDSHAGLKCERCHTSPTGKKIEAENSCFSCHKDRDFHSGSFTENCDWCHNVKEFKDVKGFHKMAKQKKLENLDNIEENCFRCHKNDDIHNGSFGKFCDRCHTFESFLKLKIGK